MKKILIFHPGINPYRINFFNSLHTNFNTKIYLFNLNSSSQLRPFDIKKINAKLSFNPIIMPKSINIFGREIPFRIGKIIKTEHPDIIFTHEYSLYTLYIILYRIITRAKYKIITICDDSADVAQNCNILRKIVRKVFIRKIDWIILCNNNAYQWYALKYPKNKFLVFPIIQEESYFRNHLKKAIPISNKYIQEFKLEGKKVILFVGRLVNAKNIPLLINAFGYIIEKEPHSLLIIIGSGEKETELKQLVKNKKLNNSVLFPGRYEDIELFAWYNIGSLFVLPSTFEPFGAVTNEALLSGMPVLISAYAGSTYLINENNGNIFSLNKEELSSLLLKYLSKIPPIKKEVQIRDSLMPFTYNKYMTELCNLLKKL